MNALEKCLDMLVAIAIMFLIPVLFYSGMSRIVRSLSSGAACESFLKRVCTSGELTFPVWNELETVLDQCGCDSFEIRREYTLWEPGVETGSVTELCYIDEEEILLEKIRAEGTVRLHKGDKLRVIFFLDDLPAVYYDIVRSEGNVK